MTDLYVLFHCSQIPLHLFHYFPLLWMFSSHMVSNWIRMGKNFSTLCYRTNGTVSWIVMIYVHSKSIKWWHHQVTQAAFIFDFYWRYLEDVVWSMIEVVLCTAASGICNAKEYASLLSALVHIEIWITNNIVDGIR